MSKETLRLDETDTKILDHLVRDARKSSREIAKEVGVSHQTVLSRIKSLEENGVIKGYTTMIDRKKVGYLVKTIVLAEVTDLSRDQFKKVDEFLKTESGVCQAGVVNGDFDFYALGYFPTDEEAAESVTRLRTFLTKEFDVKRFRSYNVWETIKHTHFM